MNANPHFALAVGARQIMNRHIQNPVLETSRAKQQIEVTKGVKVTEIAAVGCDLIVVALKHDLCAAQRIRNGLIQQPAKGLAKENVAPLVDCSHRALLLL